MFATWTRGWKLFCSCWEVLKSQPSLAIYPVISGIASLIFILLFIIPLWAAGFFQPFFDQMNATTTAQTYDPNLGFQQQIDPAYSVGQYFVFFLMGITLNIVTNFCNAAFCVAVMAKLSGRECSALQAFRVAAARFPAIIGYSLIGATVGIILRAIQERGILGQIVAFVIGIAWAVITYLAIPVLVAENVGPIEGIKRSASLIKKRWGEGMIVSAGMGIGMLVMSGLVGIFGLVLILAAIVTGVNALIFLAIGLTILGLVVAGVLGRTLQGIFTVALYAHATTGSFMPGLPADVISSAFTPKQKKRFGFF